MKKHLRGSLTVEAVIIVPFVLWVFAILILLLLYFHDKNVVTAVAHETTIVGCKDENSAAKDLEVYFQKRLSGKLLLFPDVTMEAKVQDKAVTVVCRAQKQNMMLRVKINMKRTKPETYVRSLRKMKEREEKLLE